MIIAFIRVPLPEPLSLADATTLYEGSAPVYQTIEGLHRKHYILSHDGLTGGGVYLWDTLEQAENQYNDEWKAMVEERYGAAPLVDFFEAPVTVEPDNIRVG